MDMMLVQLMNSATLAAVYHSDFAANVKCLPWYPICHSLSVYCPNPSNITSSAIQTTHLDNDLDYNSSEDYGIVGKVVKTCNDCFGNGTVENHGYVYALLLI